MNALKTGLAIALCLQAQALVADDVYRKQFALDASDTIFIRQQSLSVTVGDNAPEYGDTYNVDLVRNNVRSSLIMLTRNTGHNQILDGAEATFEFYDARVTGRDLLFLYKYQRKIYAGHGRIGVNDAVSDIKSTLLFQGEMFWLGKFRTADDGTLQIYFEDENRKSVLFQQDASGGFQKIKEPAGNH